MNNNVASMKKYKNTQGSLHQRDPILIADIRVSLVQGSMLLQLNVVIVAFLINIDKRKDSNRIFRYSRGQIDNLFTVWKAAFRAIGWQGEKLHELLSSPWVARPRLVCLQNIFHLVCACFPTPGVDTKEHTQGFPLLF